MSVWESAANGVTPKTNTERQKYWNHWTNYKTATGINPFIDKSVHPDEHDIIAGAFASRVRTGRYGQVNHIKVSGFTDALESISKTIDLAGQHSKVYWAD